MGSVQEHSRRSIVLGATVPSTVSAFIMGQAIDLSEAGWCVHIVTSPGKELEDLRERASAVGSIHIHTIEMRRNPSLVLDLRGLFLWISLLRRIRPSIVMLGTPKAALLGLVSGMVVRVPHRVYLVRGLRLEGLSGLSALASRTAEQITCACASLVVSVSPSLKRALVDRGIAKATKVSVLGSGSSCGVDVDKFRPPTATQRDLARSSLGLDSNCVVVGFAGRLTRDKGVQDLIDVFRRSQVSSEEAALLIAGEAEDEDFLASLSPTLSSSTDNLGTRSNIRLLGPVKDMPKFFHALDIFCLPSHREGLPNANLEAAACGLPVITTEATGCVDSILPSTTGLIVAPRDGEKLSLAIQALVTDPVLRQELGRQGRRWVSMHFSHELVSEHLQAFLSSLVTGEALSQAQQD